MTECLSRGKPAVSKTSFLFHNSPDKMEVNEIFNASAINKVYWDF